MRATTDADTGSVGLIRRFSKSRRLLVPFEMRGFQGVYNLENRIYEAAVRGLLPVEGPLPVKFPLPDPSDPLSLRPGSLASYFTSSRGSENEKSESLNSAIAGARAAATQYSKKGQSKNAAKYETNLVLKRDVQNLPGTSESKNYRAEEVDNRGQFGPSDGRFHTGNKNKHIEYNGDMGDQGNIIGNNKSPHGSFNPVTSGAPSKVSSRLKSQSLNAAIADAQAAVAQFSKKGQNKNATKSETNLVLKRDVQNHPGTSQSKNYRAEEVDNRGQFGPSDGNFHRGNRNKHVEYNGDMGDQGNIIGNNESPHRSFNHRSGAPSKVFAYRVKGVRPA